jgi:Holliday junction resolvasome RuvABC endonuclease subunit
VDLRNQLEELVMHPEDNVDVDVVVLEGYAYARANQAHQVGELGGVIRVALAEWGIPYVVVAPSALKLYATGKGNASKDNVVSAVSARTGIVFAGKGANDRCDAWVLRQMGMAHYGVGTDVYGTDALVPMPKHNRTALDKVDWPDA